MMQPGKSSNVISIQTGRPVAPIGNGGIEPVNRESLHVALDGVLQCGDPEMVAAIQGVLEIYATVARARRAGPSSLGR